MKKLIVYLCIFISIFTFSCKKDEVKQSEILTSKSRSVIICNETKSEVFHSCELWTHDGLKVEGVGLEKPIRVREKGQDENIYIENIDKNKGFENYDKFKIILVDSLGIKFVKEFNANESGPTIVMITEEDIVDSNFFKKLNRTVNNF